MNLRNIRDYFKHKKEESRKRQIEYLKYEIEHGFHLIEKEGAFYIVCEGIAIEKFHKHITLEYVQGRMKELRNIAKSYALPNDAQ